nr:late histone H2B.L4-like [Maniola hyperantus]
MAPKAAKKPTTMEKPDKVLTKPITKKSKKKKNYQSFGIYLFKVLRSLNDGRENQIGISRQSMLIMNNFVNDMIEKIATEAGRLAVYAKKNTMSDTEISSATKLLLPGELARHANIEGMKAMRMYQRSVDYDANRN